MTQALESGARAISENADYLREVREHYENYPYPLRDPEDEKKRLQYTKATALDSVNYYHFAGKRDFSKGFRGLVAGGGTGDSLIFLAEQCRDWDAHIVYLDISSASMQVAKSRADMRGLSNITWVHGSLLDAPKLLEGQFDYIDCSGVLHHLESPEAGLAALADVLHDDGVMSVMLYAKYGREGVYQIQNLMRLINHGEKNLQRKVDNCKAVLKNLPPTSGYLNVAHMLSDVSQYGDVGIYDLLLHSQDVAYSIPEIYTFLATSNLKLTHLIHDPAYGMGKNVYNLETYIKDGSLREAIAGMTPEQKLAAAELMHGKIMKHIFYTAKREAPLPSPNDLNIVPHFSFLFNSDIYQITSNALKNGLVGQNINCSSHGEHVVLIKTANAERIFRFMDGEKTLGEILKEVRQSYATHEKAPSMDDLKNEFVSIFTTFNNADWMFLKAKGIPSLKTAVEIQDRMNAFKK